jgi:putative IMPACT (imprinted ancient) family translation regulator
MDINYKTIRKGAIAEYEISKSHFLTFVEPIADEAASIAFINKIKKQYFDARHNCSAYVIGQSTLQKADDDGEPSGTAGKPILEVIKKK